MCCFVCLVGVFLFGVFFVGFFLFFFKSSELGQMCHQDKKWEKRIFVDARIKLVMYA